MKHWQLLINCFCILATVGCGSGMSSAANTALPTASTSSNPVTTPPTTTPPTTTAPSTTPTSSVDPADLHQATSAFDFSNSVGVNTHFSYTNSAYYLRTPEVIEAIEKMRVHHVRDGLQYSWVAPNLYSIHAQLESAGIHADLVVPNPSTTGSNPSLQKMESLLQNYPDAENIEAPNEYDEASDKNWVSDLKGYLPSVLDLGHHSGMAVFGPSLTKPGSYTALGDVARYMDYNNYHAYWGGRNPESGGWGGPDAEKNYYGSLGYDLDELQVDGPSRPVVMTETGYVSNGSEGKQNNLPEGVEAIYEPRLLLHCWNSGFKRTYVYELLDEPSSTKGYGLLHSDLTPRPAYTAIVNLMGLLDDTSSIKAGKLGYTLTGNTTGVESTLLQKSDGSFWLALWLKAAVYDVNALKSISVPLQVVNLSLLGGATIYSMREFDETGGFSTTSVKGATSSFAVGSGVTLIHILQ